jgi:hypothetical protein
MIKLKFWQRNKIVASVLPMKYAFTSGGVDYYEPDQDKGGLNALPWRRAMALQHFYDELNMNVDRKFLEDYVKAVDNVLSGKANKAGTKVSIQVAEVVNLNAILAERLKWIFTPDLVYKVASVVFMEKGEDPTLYDEKLNQRKIENWKKNGLEAFFLNEPVQRLLPFLNGSPKDIQSYGETIAPVEKAMNEYVLSLSAAGQELNKTT